MNKARRRKAKARRRFKKLMDDIKMVPLSDEAQKKMDEALSRDIGFKMYMRL